MEELQNDVYAFIDEGHKIFEAVGMEKDFDALCLIVDSGDADIVNYMDKPTTHVAPVSRS